MKHIVLFIFLLVTLMSCNENKSAVNAESVSPVKKDILTVSIELKTTQEDEFRIMLNQISVDDFQKMNIHATETIPVTSNYERMTTKFFENTFSNKLVIGLGNKHPKNVDINNISISYGLNSISIPKAQLHEYFNPNTFVSFDDNMSIITKTEKGRHSPLLYANSKLINLLTKQQ